MAYSKEIQRLYMKEYHQRPKVMEHQKEYRKEYNRKPKVKARREEYKKLPKVKARAVEYYQRPKIKERQKDYMKEYMKEYRERPEVIKRIKEYRKKYNLSKKSKFPHIYIISNPVFPGVYKIGVTSNVKWRLNNYQTADPLRRYKLEFSLEHPQAKWIEESIHKIFQAQNEWVSVELEDIIDAIFTELNGIEYE